MYRYMHLSSYSYVYIYFEVHTHTYIYIHSNRLRLSTLNFLRDNFNLLLETNVVDSSGDEEGGGETGVVLIRLLRKEYPSLLETLLLQRKADFPLPPSQIFIRCLAKNATVRKELTSNKNNAFPIWAMLLAVVTAVIYQYVAKVTTIGEYCHNEFLHFPIVLTTLYKIYIRRYCIHEIYTFSYRTCPLNFIP
jgi:hypothetical protein